MRVLVAEDDPGMLSVLERGLRRNGFSVDTATRGDEALDLLAVNDYAAVVLDWRMPGLSGVEVVARARRGGVRTPVLMLTARDTVEDRVEGLDAGADDYLVKPFAFPELLARLRALMRRPEEVHEPLLRLGALALDPATRQAAVAGRPVALTPREHAILELLLRRRSVVVSRMTIVDHAWDDHAEEVSWNAIEAHIARLRAKLVGAGVRIVAVRGSGYRAVET